MHSLVDLICRSCLVAVFLAPALAVAQGPAPQTPQPPPTPPAAQPAGTIDAAANALLGKARTAAKATRDLSATIETKVVSEGETSTLRAAMQIVFSDDRFPLKAWRFELPAKEGSSGPSSTVSGIGDRIYQLSPSTKELVELDLKGLPPMPQEATFLLPLTWYIAERGDGAMFPGMPPAKLIAAAMGEERTLDGVRCQVVTLTRETELGGGGQSARLVEELTVALGVDDHLPRSARSVLRQIAGTEVAVQETETTYTKVRSNVGPKEDSFRITAPAGFAHRVEASGPESPVPELAVKAGDRAKEFTLKNLDGAERRLADYRGKVLVLDFWATWCGPCKQVMPTMQAIHEHFKDRPVAIVGVNVGEKAPNAGVEYMRAQKFSYECLLAGEELAKAYAIQLIPTLIIVGPDGTILLAQSGVSADEKETLIKLIEGAIAK